MIQVCKIINVNTLLWKSMIVFSLSRDWWIKNKQRCIKMPISNVATVEDYRLRYTIEGPSNAH